MLRKDVDQINYMVRRFERNGAGQPVAERVLAEHPEGGVLVHVDGGNTEHVSYADVFSREWEMY